MNFFAIYFTSLFWWGDSLPRKVTTLILAKYFISVIIVCVGRKLMRQDFLEIFEVLLDGEIQEYTIYNLIKNVHSLIRCGQKDAVPNALRKVHECLLYRCNAINPSDYPLRYYSADYENSPINISATTKSHFRNVPNEMKNQVIKPFLNFVNSGSHSEDVSYASIREDEIKDNILRLIKIVNWYLSKVKDKKKFQLDLKFTTPKAETTEELKARIEDLKKQNEQLRNELKLLKKENKELSALAEKEEPSEQEDAFEESEEGSVNLDVLEKDIYSVIDFFNQKNIYCTHRTVAFFLFGLRINQTDFKDLSKEENFGKYQNDKFTEYEYNMAINELLIKEKIFLNGHFFNTRNYELISNEELAKELGVQQVVDRDTEMVPIDENVVKMLQSAIEQNKDIEFVYLKSIPNLNKASVTNRHCKPLELLKKSSDDENYYYLKALDGGIEKHFRLDCVQDLRI